MQVKYQAFLSAWKSEGALHIGRNSERTSVWESPESWFLTSASGSLT